VIEIGKKLHDAPIIEAVLDIDCDLPVGVGILEIEKLAEGLLRDQYPEVSRGYVQNLQLGKHGDEPTTMTSGAAVVFGIRFRSGDQKQLVQFRNQGFSFNRLAPYSSLDDYLSEIQRTWGLFVKVCKPVQIKALRLRYINRILIGAGGKPINLEDYFKVGPKLPGADRFLLTGFLNQYLAMEKKTGYWLNSVLAGQPAEGDNLPIIFDNTVEAREILAVENWPCIVEKIQALRSLKNQVFWDTLTERCLEQFQKRSEFAA
jgi:uncharacterized protein (TIGR04255 family)